MPVYHFDEGAHVYTVDGVPVPSVTQLLKPIGTDFSMIRPDVLERKRQLGTSVHLACEYDDEGELGDCDDEVLGYVNGWRMFRSDNAVDVVHNEKQLFHESLRFAGTLDRVVVMQGQQWIVDIKTAAEPVPSYGVQLSGYQLLLGVEKIRRATVHLRPDGTYKMCEFKNPNDMACFRALLSLNQWKELTK